MSKKLFVVIAGPRLGGKTTTAGTLPGKTHLLQAAVLESGSRSAQKLAKRLGNELVVETFADLVDFWPKLHKAANDKSVDHIYIDGFSALHELRWNSDDIQKCHKNNTFQAYDIQGTDMVRLLRRVKEYSYGHCNVFLTCALKVEMVGAQPEAKLDVKGKMSTSELTRIGESVVTVVEVATDKGLKRVMYTTTTDCWPGRVDGLLPDENPGTIEPPDLGALLKLLETEE